MTFDPDKDATELTAESWRPEWFELMVKDGRKYRVSNPVIRIAIILFALGAFGVQLFSSLSLGFKRSTEVPFVPPKVRSQISSAYLPPIMDEKRRALVEEAQNQARRKKGEFKIVTIEKIQPIRLGRVAAIPAGSEVQAVLKSGGTNGLVKAALAEDLIIGGDVLLPQRTVLLGRGSSSEERLYVAFKKAILPDQTAIKIDALAFDIKDRLIGMKGKKVSDFAFRLAASAGLIFLGGVADVMRGDYSSNPFEHRRPTMQDAALNGVSTATSDMSRQTIESMKNQESRVEVAHSSSLIVIFGDSDAKE